MSSYNVSTTSLYTHGYNMRELSPRITECSTTEYRTNKTIVDSKYFFKNDSYDNKNESLKYVCVWILYKTAILDLLTVHTQYTYN